MEEAREYFAGFALDDVRERRGVERRLRTYVDGARTGMTSPVNKVCGGIDGARGAHHEHQRGVGNLLLDAADLQRRLAEEDDVRT